MFQQLTVLPAGTVVGRIKVPWSNAEVPVVTARPLAGLAPSGTPITLQVRIQRAVRRFPGRAAGGHVSVNGLVTPPARPWLPRGRPAAPA